MITCNHLLLGGGKIKNLKKVTTRFLSQLLCISAIIGTASCSDDQVFNQIDTAPLQVSVNAQGTQSSRAIIHGEYLPDASSIGISLFTPEGADYDNQGYFNVKYTASGEGESQTWPAQGTTPSISANEAYLLAYYPHNPDIETIDDLFALPVENQTQTDYMYAGLVKGITNANPKVNIIMQHALTAIRVNLVLGNYTGDATVSEISVKSPALASSATLNVYDGTLDNISGQSDEFALTTEFDLITAGTATDVLFVPDVSVGEGTTTVTATIGDKKYTAGISFDDAYLQGYIYTYTLTLNNSGFEVTKVNVTPWQTGNDDSATLEPEKDNAYIVKIVASYSEPGPASYIEEENLAYNNSTKTVQSRSGETFEFVHNIVGFVGTIDWGDGTTDTYTELTDNPSHYYPNNGQEYTIIAKGSMIELYCNNKDSFIQCLHEIIYIGSNCDIVSMRYAFASCYNLVSIPVKLFNGCVDVITFERTFFNCINLTSIPKGLFDKCTKVTSFSGTFSGCSNLQSIPEGLFDKCTKVTNFGGTFSGCNALTTIPEGLFDYNTEVTTFTTSNMEFGEWGKYIKVGCFTSCKNLTEIPEGLFDNCKVVTTFEGTFAQCESLTEVPNGLFDDCTKVITFKGTFYGCYNLKSIPRGLFDNCSEVTDFVRTFQYCYKLQAIPEGLFDDCINVTSFVETFNYCESLQTIPDGLFDKCTEVTDFGSTFEGCSSLQTIPEGLFDKCTEVTDFAGAFKGCSNLTGESPYTIINVDGEDIKVHLYERKNYPGYFVNPSLFRSCFYGCENLTDYNSMVYGWNNG